MCPAHTRQGPAVANRWRKLDLTLILVLNTLASYSLSYFTFGPRACAAWTLLVGLIAATGVRNVQVRVMLGGSCLQGPP